MRLSNDSGYPSDDYISGSDTTCGGVPMNVPFNAILGRNTVRCFNKSTPFRSSTSQGGCTLRVTRSDYVQFINPSVMDENVAHHP
ncbi:hypothetical protein AB1N83_006374 [Pleurotus pulmonarius]